MIPAFRLELRRGAMLILWVSLVSMLYAGIIMLFYPTILENAAEFEKMLAIYPKELMAAFGITGSLGDQGTFINSYIFQFLWPLVAAIAGILLATRVAADADSGFLDLPLSSRLPRVRYLGATIVAQIVGLAVLTALTIGTVVAVDLFIAPDFDWARLTAAGLHAFAMAAAITGVTCALAVILLDRGRAGGLVAGILIVMYMLNVVAQLAPDFKELARLSAFHYFDLAGVIDTGTYPVVDSAIFAVTAMLGWLLALWVFRRRDLAA
jgi:ABC-2 type transport system permease protein